ncbi:hypothetical protein HDU96_000909 [Phlyctochytrium bullatum]|nr:hypothetical protein HDU96_000909 [Phlyctochytrium bullatum]
MSFERFDHVTKLVSDWSQGNEINSFYDLIVFIKRKVSEAKAETKDNTKAAPSGEAGDGLKDNCDSETVTEDGDHDIDQSGVTRPQIQKVQRRDNAMAGNGMDGSLAQTDDHNVASPDELRNEFGVKGVTLEQPDLVVINDDIRRKFRNLAGCFLSSDSCHVILELIANMSPNGKPILMVDAGNLVAELEPTRFSSRPCERIPFPYRLDPDHGDASVIFGDCGIDTTRGAASTMRNAKSDLKRPLEATTGQQNPIPSKVSRRNAVLAVREGEKEILHTDNSASGDLDPRTDYGKGDLDPRTDYGKGDLDLRTFRYRRHLKY